MREYRVFHVLGERPVSVEVDGRSVDVPADWLIFNAPRPLYASPVEVVIREAFSSGGFDYAELIGESYPLWIGDFYHGRFYAAVDPGDERRVDDNVSLDGWVLAFHSEDDLVELERARYAGKGYPSDEVEELISSNRRGVVRNALDVLNGN